MATFAPADYERLRKVFGYPINALSGISRQADRFATDMATNVANVDYVAAVKDLLDLIDDLDESIALEQDKDTYSLLNISIPNEVSIQRSAQANGIASTSADGLYAKRGGYIRQLEDLLRPYGMVNQGSRVERG